MNDLKDKNPGEHGNRVFQIIINGKLFEWGNHFITGKEIRNLGNIPNDYVIFLEVKKPLEEEEEISDDKRVNLARPEIERFYSKAKEVIIMVNGTPHPWTKEKISFKEVIILAFGQLIDRPTMVYTVAYEDGPIQKPEESMQRNQEVFVKNKMIFHATATDKS